MPPDLHAFSSLEVLADAALDRLELERDALAFAAAEGVAGAYERLALVELELDRRAERGYIAGRRDESIAVAAGALREATTSAEGWALLDSHHGQAVAVHGSRVVLRVDLAARARTPNAVTDGRDAFPILAQAATADARQTDGWDAEPCGRSDRPRGNRAVTDLVGIALAARRLESRPRPCASAGSATPTSPPPVASAGREALYSYAELKAWRRSRRVRRIRV